MPVQAQRVKLVHDALLTSPFVTLNDSRFPPGWAMRLHRHPYVQVMYVTAGRGFHTLGTEHPLGPGDIVVVGPTLMHSWRVGRKGWLELVDIGIAIGDPRHRSLLVPLVEAARDAPGGIIHESIPLQPRIDAIRQAIRERAAFTDFRLQGLLWQLLADVGRAARDRRSHPSSAEGSEEIISALDRFIELHHGRHLTLSDLAAALHVSPKHLCRIASRERGASPMRILSGFRLQRARELLLARESSIAEVCASVGLPDRRHFARLFKSAFGITPSEYHAETGRG